MSHISTIQIEIKSLEDLKGACERLGLVFKENQKTFIWYSGQSSCDHAIAIPDARYEIGVIHKDGKYELQLDYFDQNLTAKIGQEGGLLKQAYAAQRVRREAKQKKFKVRETRHQNAIRLTLLA